MEGLKQKQGTNRCAVEEVKSEEIRKGIVEIGCNEVEGNSQSAKVHPSTYTSLSAVLETLPRATVVSLPALMFDTGLRGEMEGLRQKPGKNGGAVGEAKGGVIGKEVVDRGSGYVKGDSQSAKVRPCMYASLKAVSETLPCATVVSLPTLKLDVGTQVVDKHK